jgi:hypothetical protein
VERYILSSVPYLAYPYTFDPLLHLDSVGEVAVLRDIFDGQGVRLPFHLHALRRKDAWATTLPLGTFKGDFRPVGTSIHEHTLERDRLLRSYIETSALHGHPLPRHQRLTERDERVFYHAEYLRLFRFQVDTPYFLTALCRFLEAAAKDTTLIIPKPGRKPYVPPERRKDVFGLRASMCRGPGWLPEEDAVLRRWLGQHTTGPHAGYHVPLTEGQWKQLLEVELQGRRTMGSVRARCVFLNKQLADRFVIDGFLPREAIRTYLSLALGEKPRLPRVQQPRVRRRRTVNPII